MPLICVLLLMLINQLIETSKMLIKVKRLELRKKGRIVPISGGEGENVSETQEQDTKKDK